MRCLLLIGLLLCSGTSLHAQWVPIYGGGGVGAGSFPHLFSVTCADGDRGIGPDIWAGVRLGNVRVAGRAAFISDPRRERTACAGPEDGTPFRQYNAISDDATLLDVRVLYSVSFNKLNIAGGGHVGRLSELDSRYYGLSGMVRYGVFGIGADYSRQQRTYREYQDFPLNTPDIVGPFKDETVGAFFIKAFVEMTR